MMEVDGQKGDFDLFRDMKFVVNLVILIASFFSKTVEVFLRRDFGERYLRFEILFFTFVVLNFMTLFSNTLNPITGMMSISGGLLIFSYAFLAVGVYHKIKIIMRSYEGEIDTHSYCFGRQWGIWKRIFPDDGFFNKMFPLFNHRVTEPAFIFIIGLLAMAVDATLGRFIMFAGFCLMISMQLYYKMELTRFLDRNDARIVSQGDNSTVRFGNINLRPSRGKSAKGKTGAMGVPIAETKQSNGGKPKSETQQTNKADWK